MLDVSGSEHDRIHQAVATLDLALLNDWQRDFPLCSRPFEAIASSLGCSASEVKTRYALLQQSGALGRIGAFSGGGGRLGDVVRAGRTATAARCRGPAGQRL